ncbi:MAG TPA: hypothetical protein VK737_01950 [Opitutales bacterium]|nr:hypothetical protein [Opitutales bacterium]
MNTITAITPGGVVSTYASGFDQMEGMVAIGDTLYVADDLDQTVYAVAPGGVVSAAAPPGFWGVHPFILATDGNSGLCP